MDVKEALKRLNSQLPLQERQSQLNENLKAAHRAILHSLVNRGGSPQHDELARLFGEIGVEKGLQRLAQDDLIVLDATGKQVVGAYPVTIEKTPHRISVNDQHIYAMCALDAVSVAPMFNAVAKIESRCQLSKKAISMVMKGAEILAVTPSTEVRIGVRWQMPCGAAAHSMCLEMGFLLDEQIARDWQQGDGLNKTIFELPQAVEFGSRFFMPLLEKYE